MIVQSHLARRTCHQAAIVKAHSAGNQHLALTNHSSRAEKQQSSFSNGTNSNLPRLRNSKSTQVSTNKNSPPTRIDSSAAKENSSFASNSNSQEERKLCVCQAAELETRAKSLGNNCVLVANKRQEEFCPPIVDCRRRSDGELESAAAASQTVAPTDLRREQPELVAQSNKSSSPEDEAAAKRKSSEFEIWSGKLLSGPFRLFKSRNGLLTKSLERSSSLIANSGKCFEVVAAFWINLIGYQLETFLKIIDVDAPEVVGQDELKKEEIEMHFGHFCRGAPPYQFATATDCCNVDSVRGQPIGSTQRLLRQDKFCCEPPQRGRVSGFQPTQLDGQPTRVQVFAEADFSCSFNEQMTRRHVNLLSTTNCLNAQTSLDRFSAAPTANLSQAQRVRSTARQQLRVEQTIDCTQFCCRPPPKQADVAPVHFCGQFCSQTCAGSATLCETAAGRLAPLNDIRELPVAPSKISQQQQQLAMQHFCNLNQLDHLLARRIAQPQEVNQQKQPLVNRTAGSSLVSGRKAANQTFGQQEVEARRVQVAGNGQQSVQPEEEALSGQRMRRSRAMAAMSSVSVEGSPLAKSHLRNLVSTRRFNSTENRSNAESSRDSNNSNSATKTKVTPQAANKSTQQQKAPAKISLAGAKRRLGFKTTKSCLNSLNVHRSEEILPDSNWSFNCTGESTSCRHLELPSIASLSCGSRDECSGAETEENSTCTSTNWLSQFAPLDPRASFVDDLGAGQIASKQALVSPYLGDVQLSICDSRGMLEVEIIVWADNGKRDRKSLMGVAQIHLGDLDISELVIGWYRLFNAPSFANSMLISSSKALRRTISTTRLGDS